MYRFTARDDFLNQIGPEYGTDCFCSGNVSNVPQHSNGCLLRGAMDLSLCQGECVWRQRNL